MKHPNQIAKERPFCIGCKTTRVRRLTSKFCSLKCYLKTHSVENSTKEELFSTRTNWQSARSSIQKHARVVFFANIKEAACEICGYTNHVEVAHRKSVASFDDSCTVLEINDVSNLIGLCPNHHWEFDNGNIAGLAQW